MLGSAPKMMIIVFCLVIAAYTTEITFRRTDSVKAAYDVCNFYPNTATTNQHACLNLMSVAISSILVCMVLMILDVFIPCVNTKFKRIAHGISILLSLVMAIMLLVTSSWMANLYTRYCDYINDYYYNINKNFSTAYHYYYQAKCGKDENHFLILPLFGYFTLCAWGLNGLVSVIRLRSCE